MGILRRGQASPAPEPSPAQYVPAPGGAHPRPEAMCFAPVPAVRLESPLHRAALPSISYNIMPDSGPFTQEAPPKKTCWTSCPTIAHHIDRVQRKAEIQTIGRLWISYGYPPPLSTFCNSPGPLVLAIQHPRLRTDRALANPEGDFRCYPQSFPHLWITLASALRCHSVPHQRSTPRIGCLAESWKPDRYISTGMIARRHVSGTRKNFACSR